MITKSEAIEYVKSHASCERDEDDLEQVLAALYGAPAEAGDREEGLWFHCQAFVERQNRWHEKSHRGDQEQGMEI